jgi:hypothetical protein
MGGTMRSLVFGLLGLLVLGGCSTMRVTSDYDRDADFSQLRTFDWMPTPPRRPSAPRLGNLFMQRRIREALERELTTKGYRNVSRDPDFLVAFFTAAEDRVAVQRINEYWGYRRYRGRWVTRVHVDHYRLGTLIVDIVDPRGRELIWRGWATDAVRGRDPERMENKMNEAVVRILREFPPER